MSIDSALDKWIDFVESKSWAFGGGGSIDGNEVEGFVTTFDRGTLTEKHRLAIDKWFNAQDWVDSYYIGELRDAWHG